VNPKQNISQDDRKRDEHLSTDGKWRSFPRVPHLLQYVSNDNYYGRIKLNGKVIRESLETAVWTTAKLKLADFLKGKLEGRGKVAPPLFSEAVELFKRELESDTGIKPQSRKYRLWCLQKIQRSWPELWELRLDGITEQACRDWAAKLNKEIASHYFNNTIGTLKLVIEAGIKAHKEKCGERLENPAAELRRVRVKQKELQLPEPSHFKDLVKNLRLHSGGWGPRISATGIKINSLFGECRVRRFQGQKSVVMPTSVAFDPVSAGADNDVGEDSGGVIGVTKAPVVGQFPDLGVGEVAVDDRPQVLNLGAAGWLRRHAVFGQQLFPSHDWFLTRKGAVCQAPTGQNGCCRPSWRIPPGCRGWG
jgi:hypothetical protein